MIDWLSAFVSAQAGDLESILRIAVNGFSLVEVRLAVPRCRTSAHLFPPSARLDLQPSPCAPTDVQGINPLSNHSFEVPFLKLSEEMFTSADDMIGIADSASVTRWQGLLERCLTFDQWTLREVIAIEI